MRKREWKNKVCADLVSERRKGGERTRRKVRVKTDREIDEMTM